MKAVAAIVLLVLCVPVAGAASVRSVTAPAPVLALAVEGSRVVYASGRSRGDCNRVRVWNLATRGVTTLGRRTTCAETSTGNAIASVAVAGARVLWVHYVGGNTREWSLWTASVRTPSPVRLRAASSDADAPPPIVIGPGDDSRLGSLLPYAVDRAVVALRADGARAFAWNAPARVVALSAFQGELAVASAGGIVTVLDGRGRVLSTERFGAEIDAVRVTGSGLVVQHGRTLELRGGRVALYSLAPGVRLAAADGDRAVLVGGGKVRSFDLDSGAGGVVTSGSLADLEGGRLASAAGRLVSVR